jgi:serpin B
MKKKLFTITLLVSIGIICCSPNDDERDSGILRDLTPAEISLKESSNEFGFKVFRELVTIDANKNIFISPLSMSMALGMTYNGAAGETKTAMHSTLGYGDLSDDEINESYKSLIELLTQLDPKVIFNIANSIWYRQELSVLQDFINTNKEYFDAAVRALDFNSEEAADVINNWVNEKTKGKIKEIVDKPIDPLTVMFLINAIYFKGTWTYEFDKGNTREDIFYLPDGTTTQCKMMNQTGNFKYFSSEKFQAIDLPYGDGYFSMTIFLPEPETDIDSLIHQLNNDNWNLWVSNLSKQEVMLYFPKFEIEYEKELKDVLSILGMEIAFDPDSADFSRINPDRDDLHIDKVKHKTYVKVNEEGTEAAAATSVGAALTSAGTIMKVNRPFIFAIRENNSGTILFMGKIVEPIWEE